jgi:hypothetical protein
MMMLNRENMPRWYTLTVEAESGFPCVRIYDDILKGLPTFRPEIIAHVRQEIHLDEKTFPYQDRPAETFGFGNSLQQIGSANGQTTYRLNLPIIRRNTDETCEECNGTKERHGCDCHYCSATGRKSVIDWKEALALSASMVVFMELLESAHETLRDHTPNEQQILTLNLMVRLGQHGGSLYGRYSPHFIKFLKSYGEDVDFELAKKAMKRVNRYMWQSRKPEDDHYDMFRMRAWQNLPGNLILDVPGDACGIHPSPFVHDIPDGEGDEFTCHNVDSSLQQLTLVTGLAAMCDMIG